jgi:hypothetical protein
MLPIIIGAVSLIAYGLFDENSKPKAVKKMAKGGGVDMYSKFDLNKSGNYFASINNKNYEIIYRDDKSQMYDLFENNKKIKSNRNIRNLMKFPKKYKDGGMLESQIDVLYEKSGFINDDFNWKLKLIEMLQDSSIEAYQIYQKLDSKQKEVVLQELFSMDNDMGAEGDGEIETSRENLEILLEDAKNGKKYAKGGTTDSSDRKYSALKSGKRTSRKYASVEMRGGGVYHRRNANQYGKVKGGKTYYEYSENRTDKRVYLEKGGSLKNSIKVEREIVEYAKTHNRSETLLYNNRNFSMYSNPTELQKKQYEVNRLYILAKFK